VSAGQTPHLMARHVYAAIGGKLGSADSNRGPLVPQTSAHLAGPGRIQSVRFGGLVGMSTAPPEMESVGSHRISRMSPRPRTRYGDFGVSGRRRCQPGVLFAEVERGTCAPLHFMSRSLVTALGVGGVTRQHTGRLGSPVDAVWGVTGQHAGLKGHPVQGVRERSRR